jgi:hypothetical protein
MMVTAARPRQTATAGFGEPPLTGSQAMMGRRLCVMGAFPGRFFRLRVSGLMCGF